MRASAPAAGVSAAAMSSLAVAGVGEAVADSALGEDAGVRPIVKLAFEFLVRG